ncbi:MAG: helix-turn-helix domain-containing protein [Lachnospiraceae bacterium]|nr:helix-turn-helix domain-containing protein [Lachnospiraceae bacterium]
MEERDFAREYGIRCRQIRMARGISQQKLADLMHVTPQAVSKWEKEGVTNVNTVQQLPNVLGQDITADQIDQEGKIGEVGKEILSILVASKGFVDYSDLLSKLYGMSADRVCNEIFKLERIGAVVREQYTDYLSQERDSVIITAKGLIAYKNCKEFPDMAAIQSAETLEMRLGDQYLSLQEKIDQDELGKILWKLPYHGAFRIDYIHHLKKHFLTDFPGLDRTSISVTTCYDVLGESCFVDLIGRMVHRSNDGAIEELEQYDEIFENMDDDWHDRKIYQSLSMDATTARAQSFLSVIYPQLPDFKEIMAASFEYTDKDDDEAVEAMADLMDEEYNCYDPMAEFFKELPEKNLNNCARWFTKEQVEEFLARNYAPASNDKEKEIEETLHTVWKLEPKTLEYFYSFPGEWERNGLAGKIRKRFGVPKKG